MILNSANAQTKPDFFKNLIHDPEHYTLEETATDGKVCFRVDDQRSSNSEFHLFEKSVWA